LKAIHAGTATYTDYFNGNFPGKCELTGCLLDPQSPDILTLTTVVRWANSLCPQTASDYVRKNRVILY